MAWNPSPEVAVARDAANKLTSHYGVKVQKCIVTFVLADDRLGCASYGVDKAHCAAAKSLADAIYEAAMDHYGDPTE